MVKLARPMSMVCLLSGVLAACSAPEVESTFQCTEMSNPAVTFGGTLDVNSYDICEYDTGGDHRLRVQVNGGQNQFFEVQIPNFAGPGTYMTSEGATEISIRAQRVGGNQLDIDGQSPAGDGCGVGTCTITASGDIATTTPGSRGRITLDVTCARLRGAAVGCIECTQGPVIHLDTPNCLALAH